MWLKTTWAVLAGAASVHAGGVDWKKALEEPLSPGSVAILAEEGHRPEVQARWRTALADASPRVRAAAARSIYAASAAALVPDVVKALASETDLDAADEQALVLAVLAPAHSAEPLLAAAKRLPRLRRSVGDRLGRARGIEALSSYAALREADDEKGALRRALIRAATHDSAEAFGAAGAIIVREGDAVGWHEWWNLVRGGATMDPAVVVASLAAGPKLRAISFWGLAIEAQNADPLPPAIEEALRRVPEAQAAEGAEADATLAFEMLGRARGASPREDLAWARSLTRETVLPGPLAGVARLLTGDERRVLVEAKVLSKSAHEARPDTPGRRKPEPTLTFVNADSFPKGYVTGLAAAAGCRPKGPAAARARVIYDILGQLKSVSAARFEMPDECAHVAKILLLSSHLYSFSRRSAAFADGTRVVHIGFLDPDEMACLEQTERDEDAAEDEVRLRVGEHIKDPKKLRHVQPQYPAEIRQKRIQGMVILETTINPCGQVSDLEILRGIEGLNEAAATAVRQWRFTPTLLNGKPVPVIYTVTVNFALQ